MTVLYLFSFLSGVVNFRFFSIFLFIYKLRYS